MLGATMRTNPPKKTKGVASGRRRLDGEAMDIAGATVMMLGPGGSEKMVRARVARGELPYRKLHGRIIFLRSELTAFLTALPGVTLEQALANAKNGAQS